MRPFRLEGESGDVYTCDVLIICTGAQARWLGIPSEETYQGHGVSACATCDGFFYRGKHVVVVGGGNTAVEEAIFLTNFARKVTVVHRRDSFRAEKIMQDRLFKNPKIEVVLDSAVESIIGNTEPKSVTGVRLKNVKTGKISDIAADGVFIAIGHSPATLLFKGQLEMTAAGTDHAPLDGDLDHGRVRRWRRQGRDLPPGSHGRGYGVHGCARGGAVSGGCRKRGGSGGVAFNRCE